MRIVGGRYAGRHLTSPGREVRPTPEQVRIDMMETLAPELEGARFLDLFAGSGAVGLEALSRGASRVDFVENGPSALHALKANVAALRATTKTRLFKRDVIPWIERVEARRYDVAWVDPPYGSRKLDRVVAQWSRTPFAAVLVLEHDKEHTVAVRGKRFDFVGPTRITVARAPNA